MASTDSSLPSVESTAESGVIFRRGLLHPFGVSLFIIVEKACTKLAQDVDLDGAVTKKIAAFLKSALPFIYAVQYQWLILLSFVDDHIIVVVNMLTTIFPPSKPLFNKIDSLIDAVETLPPKFDNFPLLFHWVLTTAWMNFLIPTIIPFRSSSNDTWEKEITVDIINCESQNEINLERSAEYSNANCSNSKSSSETVGNIKCSYKEILEKGKKQSAEDCHVTEEINPETYFSTDEADQDKDKDDDGSNEENIVSEDPILELFEASWHMNPTKGTSFPTSYSFT